MYLLELNHGGGEIHRYFLLPGREYTIGRKECDILLPLGEPSISRHHATIKVAPMPRYAALDAKSELEISLFDHSKHGTFVDRERVGKDISRFIYPEDHIRFGMRVTGKVIPVAFVLAISPALPDAVLDVVVDAAVQIGAHVLEDRVPAPQEFYDRHVNCLGFLFVSEDKFAMDTPMMESLGYGYTLVTPSYLRTLAGELAANFALPPTDFPLPVSPVPGSLALRSTNYRRPAQTFFAFSEFLSLGKPIVSKVFRTYTFLLIEDPIKVAYNRVLEVFGGAVVQVALDNLTLWKNMPTEPTTVVLVSEAHFQTISDLVMAAGTGKDAASLSTTHSDPVVSAYLELYNNYICMVPEENVHLALYRDDQQELNRKPTACYLQRAREEPTTRPSGSSTAAADAATTNGSAPRASTSAPRASASAGRASANASPDSTGTKTPDGERFTVRKKPPASASSGFKKPAPTNGKDSVGGGKADEDTATSEAAPEPAPPPPEPVVATPSNKPNPAAAAAAATASPAVAPAADADGNKGSNGAKPEMQVAEHEETAPAAGEAEPPLVTEAGGSANGEEDGGAADASDDAAEVEPRAPYAEATPAHPSERLPSKNTVSAAMRAVEAGVSRRSTVSEQRRLPVAAHPTASVAADKSPSPDYQEPYEGRSGSGGDRRAIVIHQAAQSKSSPPRLRVEAVRIGTGRRPSLAQEPLTGQRSQARASQQSTTHADPEEGSGSLHRGVVRRTTASTGAATASAVNRRESQSTLPRPAAATAATTTPSTSGSEFHRSDSSRIREMNAATPMRLTSTRVGTSVQRTRPPAQSQPSLVRGRQSPTPLEAAEAAGAAGSTQRRVSPQTLNSRRRRSLSNSNADHLTSGPGMVPGQIPGLRAGSVAHVVTSNQAGAAEGYASDAQLGRQCVEFMRDFLDGFMTNTERTTRAVLRQTYLDSTSKQYLEDGVNRLQDFLQQVHRQEQEIPAHYSTESTRKNCHEVRQKATYTLRKIKGTYDAVHAEVPQCLTRARDALSTRPMSPRRHFRYNSVSTVNDAAYRRQNFRDRDF